MELTLADQGCRPNRSTRHESVELLKRIEEAFGWVKTVAGQAKTKYRGRERVGRPFTFAVGTYNLMRLQKLMAAPHESAAELQTRRPLADRRGRHLRPPVSRSLRPGDDPHSSERALFPSAVPQAGLDFE